MILLVTTKEAHQAGNQNHDGNREVGSYTLNMKLNNAVLNETSYLTWYI